jgi:hypothetical protein
VAARATTAGWVSERLPPRVRGASGRTLRKPFVAHAVHGSLGTADPRDRSAPGGAGSNSASPATTRRFRFLWVTDHLGACSARPATP